jgi:hypothetical protein
MDTIQQIPELSPQVDVNITLNLLPFGKFKFYEMLVMPEEPITQPGGFFYPEGTSVFEIVPSPEPMMVVTY